MFGDSITDGSRSTADSNRRWPNILANRLLAERKNHLAVVNAGIGGNRILHDEAGANGPQYGPRALARFERDALAQPGSNTLSCWRASTISAIREAPRRCPKRSAPRI
jgi:hypothetical protein